MNILALETSTERSSCALLQGDRIFSCTALPVIGKSPSSSEWLLPAVRDVLAQARLHFDQLDVIAFAAGPGAFTGLRMSCALAQGLAEGLGLPVVPVTTLAGMAWQVARMERTSGNVCVLLDARMNEVYVAQYQVSLEGVVLSGEILVLSPEDVVFPSSPFTVCGNALLVYHDLLERAQREGAVFVPSIEPSAEAIARLALLGVMRGDQLDPALVGPLYVRNKVAKTVAERLAGGGRA